MRLTESSLRSLIRTLLIEASDDDKRGPISKSRGWKPPWEGGGSGSGGHEYDGYGEEPLGGEHGDFMGESDGEDEVGSEKEDDDS